MTTITNIRLMELRTTGLRCQEQVASGSFSLLEEDFADLFQLVVDGVANLDESDEYRTKTSLAFLLGK